MTLKACALLSLFIALAVSDFVGDFCTLKCADFQQRQDDCITQNDCYGNRDVNKYYTLEDCLVPCYELYAPCGIACLNAVDACFSETSNITLFEECFDQAFELPAN